MNAVRLLGTSWKGKAGSGGTVAATPDARVLDGAESRPAPAHWWSPRLGSLLRRVAGRAIRGLVVRLPWIGAGLAAAVPVISSTVKAVNAGWVPAGDDGIIATRGWDVLTSHTPLVGQYSEAGLVIAGQVMHSPGPMLYWLLALPARYGSVASLAITMGAVNTLAIIACVALARRRGGLILMFAAAIGIALMCQSLPTEAFHDIWNPAAGLFPFLLLIFLGWSLACGEYRLLPITVLVASYVTQTHLMYAAPTAVVLAVGFGGLTLGRLKRSGRARLGRRTFDRPRRRRVWPWALAALVVAAACWSLPAIDQIENNPGNLAMIVRTIEHHEPTLGASVGWNAVVRSIGIRPWWLYVPASEWDRKYDVGAIPGPNGVRATPSSTATDSTIALLVALELVVVLGAFAGRWDLAAGALIGLGMCGAIALEAASNPSSPLLAGTLGYTMWWGSELGFWVWLILAWALWLSVAVLSRPALRALRHYLRAHRPRLLLRLPVAVTVLASLAGIGGTYAVGTAVAATGKPDSHVYEYASIHAIAARLDQLIPPGKTINFRFGPLDVATQPMEPAVRFMLVHHGDRVLAKGSFDRLGSYYELYNRPYKWIVDMRDGTKPKPHATLAARVGFTDPWGYDTVSVWIWKHRPAQHQKHASHS
jgi:hypothetical protein